MLFRKLLPFFAITFAVLFLVRPAQAQFGIYGTFNGERVSGFTCQAIDNQCASPNGVAKPYGGNFGIQYDFRSYGPIRVGADFRGNLFSTNKSPTDYQGGVGIVRQYGGLAGLRGSLNVARILHPYAEIAGGYAKSNAASTNPLVYSNYGQVEGVIGLDIAVLPYLDIRALELTAGSLFGPETHGTQSIGAGFVFHLPR